MYGGKQSHSIEISLNTQNSFLYGCLLKVWPTVIDVLDRQSNTPSSRSKETLSKQQANTRTQIKENSKTHVLSQAWKILYIYTLH
jgi:hypothetical protein